MSGAETVELVKAVGLPGTILLIVMVYVVRNGGLKFIFRDEIKDDLGDLKRAMETLSNEMHEIKTDVAVMKALYNEKK